MGLSLTGQKSLDISDTFVVDKKDLYTRSSENTLER